MRLRADRPMPLRRLLTGGTVGMLAATGLAVAGPAGSASADHGRVEPGRRIVQYTVRPGDTATGLAVRHRAWTAELIAHNHLGGSAMLRVGDRIEIPVVVRAGQARKKAARKARPTTRKPAASTPTRARRPLRHGIRVPRAVPRAEVRRTIVRTARRRGVDPQLALAVAWQESGWQMDVVSSARAIGAMQVLPATAQWMELYVGRGLNPRRLRDNAAAGVELLRVLDQGTRTRRHQIAAYYQGLGAVREHGLYQVTKPYVANVRAIKRRLEAGRPPS